MTNDRLTTDQTHAATLSRWRDAALLVAEQREADGRSAQGEYGEARAFAAAIKLITATPKPLTGEAKFNQTLHFITGGEFL